LAVHGLKNTHTLGIESPHQSLGRSLSAKKNISHGDFWLVRGRSICRANENQLQHFKTTLIMYCLSWRIGNISFSNDSDEESPENRINELLATI
jgi:hypothetical protein